MAEFLRTSGISHYIEEIIIKAQEKLIIVSPYLKLSENLFERLKEKDSENIEVIFVYGKNELNEYEKRKLNSLKNLSLYFYRNLHAKCYYNESKMLITSMNLHEFSEKNNREMGVLIDKINDSGIFEEAELESSSIIKAAILEKKANLQNSTIIKSSTDFEYSFEGDLSKWLEKLQLLLSEKYPSFKFTSGQHKYIITSRPFLAENIELQIEPDKSFMRIVFQFNGKEKKNLYYLVSARKDVLEKSFPEHVVGWGNQMMRVKLDFNQQKVPNLFRYDKNSLIETLEIINTGAEYINGILNKYKD